MKKKNKSVICKFLKGQDSLGSPIYLKYNGRNTYQTSLGGVLSLIGKLLILVYFSFQIKSVFLREKKKVTNLIEKKDLTKSSALELNDDIFKVAIKLQYYGDELLGEPFDS